MSPSSFGVSNTQIMSSKLICQSSYCMPLLPQFSQVKYGPTACKNALMMMSQRSTKALTICHAQSSLVKENKAVVPILENGAGAKRFPDPPSQLIPNSSEVKYLLHELCDTTTIAEFELKLNGFHLQVTRALSGGIDPPTSQLSSPSSSVSTSSHTTVVDHASSESVSTTSLAIIKPGTSEIKSRTLLERAADEGLAIILSPKVGFFRRCRTIKGKRAPPACKEKQTVKEGQVICYIEQIGWEAPIESDVAGEVTKFLCEDGDPVGYGDPIMAILPSFPGIKKLPAEN